MYVFSDFRKVTAEYVSSLPKRSDVILTVLYEHELFMEHSALPLLVPRQECFSIRKTHVVIPISTLNGHRTDIVEIRFSVKIMRLPRLYCRDAEGFWQIA
jgi:hypothetical protein